MNFCWRGAFSMQKSDANSNLRLWVLFNGGNHVYSAIIIGALSCVALISDLISTLTKPLFTVHRVKIGGIGLELWPFYKDSRHTTNWR